MGQQIALDALEFWVADLDRVHRLLTNEFGFRPEVAPAEHPWPARTSRLASGGVRIVLRQGRSDDDLVSRHVLEHGDTIADVALWCSDAAGIVERARDHGLTIAGPSDRPRLDLLGDGTICHSLREGSASGMSNAESVAPRAVDHVAYCLQRGTADKVARIYQDVFGMRVLESDSFDEVGGADVGMRSIVLRSGAKFTVVLTEPVSTAISGQTQRFLDAHAGPGVQHAALRYDDLPAAVEVLRKAGVEFLPIPAAYYQRARTRLVGQPIPWDTLQRLEILVDADHEGLLFQLFTSPVADRGTFFFELIERAGATGFGVNNVRALFEAVQATIEQEPGS